MLNRGAIVVIGAACGLMFLVVSIYNSRSLNSSLMAKLEETEGEVRQAIDNEENCAVKLDSKTDEATRIKNRERLIRSSNSFLGELNGRKDLIKSGEGQNLLVSLPSSTDSSARSSFSSVSLTTGQVTGHPRFVSLNIPGQRSEATF